MAAPAQQILYAGFSLLCAAIASFHDVRERRIPNLLTVPALAAGLLLHLLFGGWSELGSSGLAAFVAGASFFLIFLAGGMGAGDVKLMAAVGSIIGLPSVTLVMLSTVFAGAFAGLAWAAFHGRLRSTVGNVGLLVAHHGRRGLTPHPELNLANAATLRLPFALPIATGCAINLLATVLGARS